MQSLGIMIPIRKPSPTICNLQFKILYVKRQFVKGVILHSSE